MRALLLIALVLLPVSASATTYFATGFDLCLTPDAADTTYWGTVVGSPTITTTVEATTGNRCAMRYALGAGAAYVAPVPWSAASSLRATCRLRVTSIPNGCRRDILSFAGSGGDWSGRAAILSMIGVGSNQYQLQASYGSVTQKTCSGSPALGKQCTTVAECPELNPNEAQCTATAFASSSVQVGGSTYALTLTQDNGSGATAGTVTVGLYEGSAGLASAVYPRGSASRIVGECSGGTNDLAPCNVASECPGGSCATSNVVAPTTARLGTSDVGCAVDYTLDDCWIYDGTVRPNVRLETLYPNPGPTSDTNWDAVGSAHGCSDTAPWDCLIDPATGPDGNDSALGNSNAVKPTIGIPFGALSTPSPLATPVAVAFEYVAQDTASGGGNSMILRLEPEDDHGIYTSADTFDFESFAGTGGSGNTYYQGPSVYREAASNASAWDFTSIDALRTLFRKTAGSGNEGRITSTTAVVIGQTADPPVPEEIYDRDQDGDDTVCFVGDSTWDNVEFQNNIVAGLVEPDNIYFYTRGGAQLGDAAGEWHQLIEGTTSTFLGLAVLRGTAGRTCDVVMIALVANSVHPGVSLVDPKSPTAILGVNQAGYCEDQGGADQGDPCWCQAITPLTSNLRGTPAPNITPGTVFCVNAGNFKGTPGVNGCGCTTNADCTHGRRTPGPLHTPGVCVTAPTPGACQLHLANPAVDAPPASRDGWFVPGCLNAAGCASGVCQRFPNRLTYQQMMTDIEAATDARPTPAATPPVGGKPLVIWVAAPSAARGSATGTFGWDSTFPAFEAVRGITRSRATYFVDVHARHRQLFSDRACAVFNGCTEDEESTLGIRDQVHGTNAGQRAWAQSLVDCLVVGGSDGICTGSTCTAGLTGDACGANADCDLRRCPL